MRVATIPLQRTMSDAISRTQEKLAVTQKRLSTGKKSVDFADLGTETVRNLSAHTLLARQTAQSTVSKRVETTLSLYQGHLDGLDSTFSDLRTSILTAIGTGKAAGLQEQIDAAFSQFRTSVNAMEGGTPLFAGSQTSDLPFAVEKLSDAATTPAADAFKDDDVRASARVADGVDVTYGITASDFGKGLYTVFQTLAQAGPINGTPDATQMNALKTVVGQLDGGLDSLRSVNADNGRRQNQVETLTQRGEERGVLLNDVIANNEDADMGQVVVDLSQQMAMLQASYSVFSKLSGLSLANYLQ